VKKKPIAPPKPKAAQDNALSARVDKLSLDLHAAELDIAEIKGDLLRMIRLLDVHFGPEFAQAA